MPTNLKNKTAAHGLEEAYLHINIKEKVCTNYHTISLMSHTSKIMAKIIQCRLKPDLAKIYQIFNHILEKSEEHETISLLHDG